MSDSEGIISQGYVYLATGDVQAALQIFNQVLRNTPDSADAYAGRAKSYAALGNLESALFDMDRVLALGGGRIDFFDQRGQLFAQVGKQLEALEDFRRALEVEPNADRYYRYGLTLSSLNQYGEALPYLEKAVELEPNHSAAITERGVVRMELGRFELAKEDFDLAIRTAPNYFIAWLNRAAYHYHRKAWRESVTDASRAIELSPQAPLPYKLRALAEKELGQIEEAIADLEHFFSLDLDSPDRPYLETVLKQLKKTGGQRRSWVHRWFKRKPK